MAMLRQTPTSSPVVRLRAQTDRMGRRIANIRSGATSVMGPAIRQEVYTNLTSMKWRRKHDLSADASFEECIEAAITHHIEPAVEDYVKKIVSSSDSTRKALEKIIDDIPEDPVTKRLDEAGKTYIEQVTEVDISLEKIRKIEKDIERYSNSVVAITDQATKPNGLTELTDMESAKIKTISMLKDQQEKARTTQEGKLKSLRSSTRDWGDSKHPERMRNPWDSKRTWKRILQKRSKTPCRHGSSQGVASTTHVCQLS